jgi:[ribosomal protein S18]-alanine N-acetyltransferase
MSETPEGSGLVLREMTLADLDQVEAIDQASFPTPWPKQAFQYELTRNQNALCWVAEWVEPNHQPILVAATVVWLILDEAHISTLAVHPGYRQRGIAQRLLAKVLLACAQAGAAQAYLEVRANNHPAQSLYRKFGFEPVGMRKGYYQDTGEDAVLMTLADFDPVKLAELVEGG